MRFSFAGIFLVILLSSLVFGQQSSRRQKFEELKQINSQLKILREERKTVTTQQINVLLKLKSVSEQDKIEAEKLGAKPLRLFPCCEMEDLVREMDEITYTDIPINVQAKLSFSSYQIADLLIDENARTSYEYPETLQYSENTLNFARSQVGNHGFIFDLGETAFENIGEQTKEFTALAEYQPPTDEKNIRQEFVSKGLTFGQSVPIVIGNTYILRVVKYSTTPVSLDGIFAIKIHRLDKDGSIILFLKTIKTFETPKLKDPKREEFDRVIKLGLVAKLNEEFGKKGFKDIQVEVSDRVITLKGSVAIGKSAEAVEIAENLYYGAKVKSQLTEQ
jgi:hypothetical protein